MRHHQNILAYLRKKEDQLVHKWGMHAAPTSVASVSRVPATDRSQVREKPKTKAYVKDTSAAGMPTTNTPPVSGQAKEGLGLNSRKITPTVATEVKPPSVDCKHWKLSDVGEEIDYSTFVNQAALKKQQNLPKSNSESEASSYISPWLYIVIPVIDPSPLSAA